MGPLGNRHIVVTGKLCRTHDQPCPSLITGVCSRARSSDRNCHEMSRINVGYVMIINLSLRKGIVDLFSFSYSISKILKVRYIACNPTF